MKPTSWIVPAMAMYIFAYLKTERYLRRPILAHVIIYFPRHSVGSKFMVSDERHYYKDMLHDEVPPVKKFINSCRKRSMTHDYSKRDCGEANLIKTFLHGLTHYNIDCPNTALSMAYIRGSSTKSDLATLKSHTKFTVLHITFTSYLISQLFSPTLWLCVLECFDWDAWVSRKTVDLLNVIMIFCVMYDTVYSYHVLPLKAQ